MTTNILEKLFMHNHWANLQILQACSGLSDQQLDAQPKSAMYGSIRQTLLHLVGAQRGYLRLLTLPVDERRLQPFTQSYDELQESALLSGEGLLNLVRAWELNPLTAHLQTTDNWDIEPWVILLQIINHATEHREQIKGMLTSLGVAPPEIDGWSYGEFSKACIPMSA